MGEIRGYIVGEGREDMRSRMEDFHGYFTVVVTLRGEGLEGWVWMTFGLVLDMHRRHYVSSSVHNGGGDC